MSNSVLTYLRNYRQDLEYWIQQEDVSSINHITSGTPTFKTMLDCHVYLRELDRTIERLTQTP